MSSKTMEAAKPGAGKPGSSGSTATSLAALRSRRTLQRWTAFRDKCLARRLDAATFESYAAQLAAEEAARDDDDDENENLLPGPAPALPPALVAAVFLRPTRANHDAPDPRVPQYVEALLRRRLVDAPAVLRALYAYSTLHRHAQPHNQHNGTANGDNGANGAGREEGEGQQVLRWRSSYDAEEVLFYRLAKFLAIRTPGEALAVGRLMARWMALFVGASRAFAELEIGQLLPQAAPAREREEMEQARAGFVMLLRGFCAKDVVRHALSKDFGKDVRRQLFDGLSQFLPTIVQSAGSIADSLEVFRTETLAGFEPVDKTAAAEDAELGEILDSTMGLENFVIPDMTISRSRAGLYIYLNAALVGRPLLDDVALVAYLHNRYQADLQTSAIDLILASFDVLANAVFRNEGQRSAHLLRSYLINKVPVLLAKLAASAPPLFVFNAEYCITTAVNQVDPHAFPPLSALFDDTNNANPLTDGVRTEFCFACALHGLVPEASIERLIGESPMQSVAKGYVKDELVQECLADDERMQELVGELENMDGNVGAVCQALTEVLGRLCVNRETMSLKFLCNRLARKPLSLDVLLLFDKPVTILRPLCELLDSWSYDEDQGESQPVYEEFGSILLLLLAFVHRYSLTADDLGIRSPGSFVTKLLGASRLSRPMEDLTEQEKSHVGSWIHGLFDTEAGGLGDEVMSSCPPQNFYLLLPTLFHQIVLAFSVKYLAEDTLRGGVEYLVDTFLLPSLIPAIMFLANQLWVDRPDEQRAIVSILKLIVLPKAISDEASTMLSSVLNIVAKPLEDALRSYQQKDPQEVEPLLRALKENIPLSRRTGAADLNELEAWTSASNGGISASIREKLRGFVEWSLQPVIGVMPTSYTHRQMLAARRLLGARRMLSVVLDELKEQVLAGSGSMAFDVAVALVCAPDPCDTDPGSPATALDDPDQPQKQDHAGRNGRRRRRTMMLREALRAEAEDCKKTAKTDPAMAENVVRLYRLVEAQLAPLPPALAADPTVAATATLLQDAAADLGLTDAALDMAAAPDSAGLTVDLSALGAATGAGDSGTTSAGGAGGLDAFGADASDLFGSADFGAGADFASIKWGDDGMDFA